MKLSIVCPTIRIKNLARYYDSIAKACPNYEWEVIFISPYAIPAELLKKGNVRYIHSYANPTVCFNMGAQLARGELLMNSTDDGLFEPGTLDRAIQKLERTFTLASNKKAILNFIYEEGALDDETLEPLKVSTSFQPPEYWTAGFHPSLYLGGIYSGWNLCMHFIMDTNEFIKLGGLDTRFSYINFNLHKLAFTAQQLEFVIINSDDVGFKCSHLPGTTKDHFAIDAAAKEEWPVFVEMYSRPRRPEVLDINDWKKQSAVWTKRFDVNNLP